MYFFTSDLHFGNDNIIEREDRPFPDIKAFEDVFVQNINNIAGSGDTLFVLGDWVNVNDQFHADPETVFLPATRIRARIILLIGNNEQRMIDQDFGGNHHMFVKHAIDHGISSVKHDEYICFGERAFYLNHFPSKHKNGFVNLFGHTHRATGLWKPYGLNVGIDLNHFRPFSEQQVIRLLGKKEQFWDYDLKNLCMGEPPAKDLCSETAY